MQGEALSRENYYVTGKLRSRKSLGPDIFFTYLLMFSNISRYYLHTCIGTLTLLFILKGGKITSNKV